MQVSAPKATFKVVLTEYERGFGQKPWDMKYFDNAQEARDWADNYNAKNNNQDYVPDWYVLAEYRGEVK